jgi:hypothetical protein
MVSFKLEAISIGVWTEKLGSILDRHIRSL